MLQSTWRSPAEFAILIPSFRTIGGQGLSKETNPETSNDLSDLVHGHMIRYGTEFCPFFVSRGKGSYVYDQGGRPILDFTSGQMCSILGHNHPAILAAMKESMETVLHLFSAMLSPPVVALCAELSQMLPPALEKTLLLTTGSESNEAALRMAKLHTGGFEVVGFTTSWHGMTAGSASSTYCAGHEGYGPAMPGSMALPTPNCYHCSIQHCREKCDLTCLEAGFELLDRQSVGAYAAIIVEPIISSGGIVELPPGYLERLRTKAVERQMLLILDEAQTALGRTGADFAFEQHAVTLDILTLSKTLGGGLPLAATITSSEIEQDCYEKGFLFYTSHVSDPFPACVGLAVLEVVRREALAQKAAELGSYLRASLESLQRSHECIGDIRGRGLLLGLELVSDRESREPAEELGARVSKRCLELGLNLNIVRLPGMFGVLRIAPPLTVSTEEIDLAIAILDEALTDSMTTKE